MNRRLKFIAVLTLVPGFAYFAFQAPQNVGADERKSHAVLSTRELLEANCCACHDSKSKKGNLDLSTLKLEPGDAGNYALWVKVHDRVRDREMPPKGMPQPDDESRASFLKLNAQPLIEVDQTRARREGRSTWR